MINDIRQFVKRCGNPARNIYAYKKNEHIIF